MKPPSTQDLAELRDIGNSPNIPGPSPLSLSPNGRELSLILTRGDTHTNTVCRGVVVVQLDNGAARVIDTGGEPILMTGSLRGYVNAAGEPAVVRPAWSPDGRWIAYLRRDHGITQVWRAAADGSHAEPVTHFASDVEEAAWSRDGQRLVIAWRPKLAEADRAITREADKGWLFDARILSNYSARPQMPAGLPREVLSINLSDGTQGPASSGDIEGLEAWIDADNSGKLGASAANGVHASTERIGSALIAPSRVKISGAGLNGVFCSWEACSGSFGGMWFRDSGKTLIFLRKEGWNKGSMGLYRWRMNGEAPRRILQTSGVISGCIMVATDLVCDIEESRSPRHVGRIDLETGRQSLIFDPNPEWAHFKLGQIQRLTWTNAYGLPSWGDLVLPPDYRPGTRLPLVITQYLSQGFLRGGTGDEYPIFPFAAHGFAVLSLQQPSSYASSLVGLKSWDQFIAADVKGWVDRRSLLSSLTTGVDKVVAMGIADPARVGITGLSDGATTVRFALINHPTFAAAAISSCCVEPRTAMTYGGIAWADWQYNALGYPRATDEKPDFWRPVSLALNAEHIDTPLLMQLADKEMQLSLEAFTALREKGKPVEMYVFPDEYHEKIGPAHRLNAYNRSIDWFAFWLQGKEDIDPDKRDQYLRWEKMRERQRGKGRDQTSIP